MKKLYIRKLNEDDLDKMIKVAEDKYKYGEMSKEKYLEWLNAHNTDFFEKYLEKMKQREIGQGEEDIKGINFYQYYLIENDEIIGTSSIRTNIECNNYFNKYSGNIGYTIIPSKRQKGYGTIFLHLLLQKCKELGIKEVMLVCKVDNFGSQRVIENNLGSYIDTVLDPCDNEYYKRYLINIEKSIDSFETKKSLKNKGTKL